jgi:TonB family protein
MAPIAKEPELQNSPTPSPNSTQKVQPVALEIAVTVNGARAVEGTDKREPFSETTQTVLVFGNGAVIRLSSSVAPGQLLFLTNEKTKKEVVCQVVKSKNYRSVSGYVELEFTEPAVGFWGMRFPSDRIGTAPQPSATTMVTQPKPAPVAASGEAISAVTPQPAKPVILPSPPSAPVSVAPPIAIVPPPPPGPVAPTPASTAPLKVAPTPPVDNATEELKKQAARLQEQLSSMLFSEAPATKQADPAIPVPSADVSDATAKIFEISKAEPPAPQEKTEPVSGTKAFEPLHLTPIAPKPKPSASLHEEEVKIPSWLEPLARNAATPAPHAAPQSAPQPPAATTSPVALTDDLDAQVAGESYDFGAKSDEASAAATGAEVQAPNFGSDLFANTEVVAEQPAEGGSKKGIWIGAIAATILLAAGGGYWYLQQSGHTSANTTATNTAATLSQPISQPAIQQQQAQQQTQTFVPASSLQSQTSKPYSTVPSQVNSQPSNPGNVSIAPATEVQKIPANHEALKPATESTASHSSEPAEDARTSSFSGIRLAAPTVKGSSTQNLSPAETEPGIALENNNAATPLSSALGGTRGNQPAAPIPVGGEVKPAVLISSVPPVYPQMARTQRVGGDVKIDALIDEHGRVTSMKVVSGPVMLYQAAQDALRQWKYRPATLNGESVSMHLLVTIQFKLQ